MYKVDGVSFYTSKGYDAREQGEFNKARPIRKKCVTMYEWRGTRAEEGILSGEFKTKQTYAAILRSRIWLSSIPTAKGSKSKRMYSDSLWTSGSVGVPFIGDYEIIDNFLHITKTFNNGRVITEVYEIAGSNIIYKGWLNKNGGIDPNDKTGSEWVSFKKPKKLVDEKQYNKIIKPILKQRAKLVKKGKIPAKFERPVAAPKNPPPAAKQSAVPPAQVPVTRTVSNCRGCFTKVKEGNSFCTGCGNPV